MAPNPSRAASAIRQRNRDATAQLILVAAKQVLAEQGFQEFGINAIARRAGCDKQLIYRYFGGLDGLAEAIGAGLATDLACQLKPLSLMPAPTSYSALMARLALGLLEILRGDRLMQQIIAWETAAPSPLLARLTEARAQALSRWMQDMRGSLSPPPGLDFGALNALLIAAVQHMVIAGAANGRFAGMPLITEADWARVRGALTALVSAIYADEDSIDPSRADHI